MLRWIFVVTAIACVALSGQCKSDMMEDKFIISAGGKELSATFAEVKSGASVLDVHIEGRTLSVTNIDDSSPVYIYDSTGKSVYHGFNRKITLPYSGMYVVMCGQTKTKVMIK